MSEWYDSLPPEMKQEVDEAKILQRELLAVVDEWYEFARVKLKLGEPQAKMTSMSAVYMLLLTLVANIPSKQARVAMLDNYAKALLDQQTQSIIGKGVKKNVKPTAN